MYTVYWIKPFLNFWKAARETGMSACGVCREIVTNSDEGIIEYDWGCTKWYHCICVGIPQDNISYTAMTIRDNKLKWFCDSCKDQVMETNPRQTPITWGKMKGIKQIRKSLNSVYQKLVKWQKKLCANPRRKSWKNTNCGSVSSYRTL